MAELGSEAHQVGGAGVKWRWGWGVRRSGRIVTLDMAGDGGRSGGTQALWVGLGQRRVEEGKIMEEIWRSQ